VAALTATGMEKTKLGGFKSLHRRLEAMHPTTYDIPEGDALISECTKKNKHHIKIINENTRTPPK